jgi:hypothetical protein
MDFWKSSANLNPFRKMRAGALPKYALFYLKLSFRSWLRFTNTVGTDLIYKTALSLSLLLCFSVSTAFGACIAVSGSSCYRPGGTNPLTSITWDSFTTETQLAARVVPATTPKQYAPAVLTKYRVRVTQIPPVPRLALLCQNSRFGGLSILGLSRLATLFSVIELTD